MVQPDRSNGRVDSMLSRRSSQTCIAACCLLCVSNGDFIVIIFFFHFRNIFYLFLSILYMYILYLDHMYPKLPWTPLNTPPSYLHHPQPLPAGILTDLVDLILCPTCHITTVVMSLGVQQPCYVQETASLSTLSHPQAHPVLPALLPPCSLSLDLSQHIHLSSVSWLLKDLYMNCCPLCGSEVL